MLIRKLTIAALAASALIAGAAAAPAMAHDNGVSFGIVVGDGPHRDWDGPRRDWDGDHWRHERWEHERWERQREWREREWRRAHWEREHDRDRDRVIVVEHPRHRGWDW